MRRDLVAAEPARPPGSCGARLTWTRWLRGHRGSRVRQRPVPMPGGHWTCGPEDNGSQAVVQRPDFAGFAADVY